MIYNSKKDETIEDLVDVRLYKKPRHSIGDVIGIDDTDLSEVEDGYRKVRYVKIEGIYGLVNLKDKRDSLEFFYEYTDDEGEYSSIEEEDIINTLGKN